MTPGVRPAVNPSEHLVEEIQGKFEGHLFPRLNAKIAIVGQFPIEQSEDPTRLRRLGWITAASNDLPADKVQLAFYRAGG